MLILLGAIFLLGGYLMVYLGKKNNWSEYTVIYILAAVFMIIGVCQIGIGIVQ